MVMWTITNAHAEIPFLYAHADSCTHALFVLLHVCKFTCESKDILCFGASPDNFIFLFNVCVSKIAINQIIISSCAPISA